MNISTDNINRELLKVANTKNSLLVLYADAILMGNIIMIHSLAKDVSMLNIIYSALTNCVIFDRDDAFVSNTIFKGREYIGALSLSSYIDFYTSTYVCTSCPNFESIMPNVIVNTLAVTDTSENIYNIEYSSDWYSQSLTVTEIGQTTITDLTVNMTLVDLDSLILEVQGDNPLYTVGGNGYHIVDTTLYWHDVYRLRPNMQIKLRWKY